MFTESLKRHHAVHDTDNRSKGAKVCKICKETFHLVRNLVEHHHAVHVQHKFFRCTVCNKQFSWRDNLEKHMSMHKEPHHTCIKCGRGNNICLVLAKKGLFLLCIRLNS